MKKLNILVVEDDPNLGTLLSEYLVAKGHNTTLRINGQEGLEAYAKGQFDFLILDVMMPIKDGFTLAKEIRAIDKEVPILFLTAKSMKEDTLEGFNAGADDYMTKPFSMEELLARINAITRRLKGEEGESDKGIYSIGNVQFNFNKQMLEMPDESSQKLTTKESELLKLLCTANNGILERQHALNAVWGDDNYFNGRSMDVYITKLRKYFKAYPEIEIANVHGKGFKLLVHS